MQTNCFVHAARGTESRQTQNFWVTLLTAARVCGSPPGTPAGCAQGSAGSPPAFEPEAARKGDRVIEEDRWEHTAKLRLSERPLNISVGKSDRCPLL